MARKTRVALIASSNSCWKGTHLSEGGLCQRIAVAVVVVVEEDVGGIVGCDV